MSRAAPRTLPVLVLHGTFPQNEKYQQSGFYPSDPVQLSPNERAATTGNGSGQM